MYYTVILRIIRGLNNNFNNVFNSVLRTPPTSKRKKKKKETPKKKVPTNMTRPYSFENCLFMVWKRTHKEHSNLILHQIFSKRIKGSLSSRSVTEM